MVGPVAKVQTVESNVPVLVFEPRFPTLLTSALGRNSALKHGKSDVGSNVIALQVPPQSEVAICTHPKALPLELTSDRVSTIVPIPVDSSFPIAHGALSCLRADFDAEDVEALELDWRAWDGDGNNSSDLESIHCDEEEAPFAWPDTDSEEDNDSLGRYASEQSHIEAQQSVCSFLLSSSDSPSMKLSLSALLDPFPPCLSPCSHLPLPQEIYVAPSGSPTRNVQLAGGFDIVASQPSSPPPQHTSEIAFKVPGLQEVAASTAHMPLPPMWPSALPHVPIQTSVAVQGVAVVTAHVPLPPPPPSAPPRVPMEVALAMAHMQLPPPPPSVVPHVPVWTPGIEQVPTEASREVNAPAPHMLPPNSRQLETKQDEVQHSRTDLQGVTTLMIRNLPSDISQVEFIKELNATGFQDKYDFAYMPQCFDRRENKGYAFINFMTTAVAGVFVGKWHRQHHFGVNIDTPSINICPANLQGLEANLQKFAGKRMRRIKNPNLRPFVLHHKDSTRAS